MTKRDLLGYLNSNFTEFKQQITILSKKDEIHGSLVLSTDKMYNFDEISKAVYSTSSCPTSTDCICATADQIILVEFKSGFKQRITKDSFNVKEGTCKKITDEEYLCKDYWNLFWKNQKHEREILLDSLKLKAIESYITLEKQILPRCEEINDSKLIPIKYIVVIDEGGIDEMENILGDLAQKSPNSNNTFSEIKNSLSRYLKRQDCASNEYFYSEILVMSVSEFLHKINLGIIPIAP